MGEKRDEKHLFKDLFGFDEKVMLSDLTGGMNINNAAGIVGELMELIPIEGICGLYFDGYLAKIRTFRPDGKAGEITAAFREGDADRGKAGGGLPLKTYFREGSRVMLTGKVQALQSRLAGCAFTFLLADYIGLSWNAVPQNNVILSGELMRAPVCIRSAGGEHVSRFYVKIGDGIPCGQWQGTEGSGIPCICWQETADMIRNWQGGERVRLLGTFQSRRYVEYAGRLTVKTAYEVFVKFIEKEGEE